MREHTFVLSTNRKGAIAETAIAAAATKLGVSVLRPIVDHARYDLAFEMGGRILRVQCKWGGLHDDGAVIKVSSGARGVRRRVTYIRRYTEDEIDLVAVYCPSSTAATFCRSLSRSVGAAIHLRLDAPKERPASMH